MSIETWFISDTHFGHKNILEYQKNNRPFSSLNEMHEVMIERWNGVVKPKDNVWHLGDVAFGKANLDILARLNGVKRLIMGNHDHYNINFYLKYFNRVAGCFTWEKCCLSHIPIHEDCFRSRYILNIHGHLHSKDVNLIVPTEHANSFLEFPNPIYYNVSCEKNNLTPINADFIRDRIKLISME